MLAQFLSFLALFLSTTEGCVPLKGINAADPSNPGPDEIDPAPNGVRMASGGPMGTGWFFAFINLQSIVESTEPAIDFRIVTYSSLAAYNAIEAYSDNYMEAWGREDVDAARQRCIDGVDPSLLRDYKDAVIAFTQFFATIRWYFPLGLDPADLNNFFAGFMGFDPNICTNKGCDDPTTVWGFAYMIVEEVYAWGLTDGYNADGSYSRQYNKIPYQDFRDRPYVPANDPWKLKNPDLWQPLLESNNIGFLFNQEHVVPHIGFSGRFFYLEDDYACSRNVPDPDYDYEEEIDLLLERMANLDDFKKGETELYDNKAQSILALTIRFDIARGLFPYSAEFFLNLFLGFDISMESTQIVWRNKVLQNRIRPPSIIHYLRGDDDITTYAGVDIEGNSQGTQTFKGGDFEGYIRTMPHAEYPSGSACLCEAVTRFYRTIMGTDDITARTLSGGPVSLTWAAGASNKETGTPASDVLYEYSKWSDISFACGIGRLNGGLHFTASIEASNELCGESGEIIAQTYFALKNGQVPPYVIDFNDPKNREIVQDRCGDYTNDESENDDDDGNRRDRGNDDDDNRRGGEGEEREDEEREGGEGNRGRYGSRYNNGRYGYGNNYGNRYGNYHSYSRGRYGSGGYSWGNKRSSSD